MGVDHRSAERTAGASIVHVSTSDLAIQYLLKHQLREMDRAGYRVAALSAPGRCSDELARECFSYDTLPIERRIHPVRDIHTYRRMRRYFLERRFDLVHTHTNKAGILGCWAAASAEAPRIVTTVHGFYFHEGMTPPLRAFYIRLYRATFRHVHRVFLQSREDVATATAEGIAPADRMVHIGNGVDLERFDPARAGLDAAARALRQRLHIRDDAPVIGIIARINFEKGIQELLEAFRRVVHASGTTQLIVVGDGPALGYFQKKAAALGIAKSVHFVGMQDDVPVWFRLFDVFALPSYREGFPRTLCEAFAMGVPCVATTIRGCRELIDDQRTGFLVAPRDALSLATALTQLVEDRALRGRMGSAARAHAVEHLDEHRVIERILAEYEALGVYPAPPAGVEQLQPATSSL